MGVGAGVGAGAGAGVDGDGALNPLRGKFHNSHRGMPSTILPVMTKTNLYVLFAQRVNCTVKVHQSVRRRS